MKTDIGIDTGDMLISKNCKIEDDDTYGTLSEKLSLIGANLVVEALDLIENKKAKWAKQEHTLATHTKMFNKEDTIINFNKPANQIVNLVRGLNPNPVAIMILGNGSYKVWQAKAVEYAGEEPNGTVLEASAKHGLVVKCDGGAVEIVEMTAPNSKKMLAKSYLNGKKIEF